MTERLAAYPGMIQALVMAEQQKQQEKQRGTPITSETYGGAPAGNGGGDQVKVIPLTRELAAGGMGPLGLAGVVEYATSG